MHIVNEQRAWSVLGVSEVMIEHFLNGENRVQANEISKRKWTHRHVAAQFHGLIDVLNGADAFVKDLHGFVNVGDKDPIGDKPWDVLGCRCGLLHFGGQI